MRIDTSIVAPVQALADYQIYKVSKAGAQAQTQVQTQTPAQGALPAKNENTDLFGPAYIVSISEEGRKAYEAGVQNGVFGVAQKQSVSSTAAPIFRFS
jgi:hypothetical protein